MNGCVCVHGQDVLNRNSFYPMAKNGTSIPNGDEPSRDEMFSVRSRILKTPPKSSNASVCNGNLDNYIGEESSGLYFARKLDEEEQRISKLCFAVQLQMWENSPPEEGMSKLYSNRKSTNFKRLACLPMLICVSKTLFFYNGKGLFGNLMISSYLIFKVKFLSVLFLHIFSRHELLDGGHPLNM